MKKIYLSIITAIVFATTVSAQLDSIYHQGSYRKFIVHLPMGYTPAVSYPLILNFHGLNSTAAQQEIYSGMDVIADTAHFIVVYPQGINNAWNLYPGAPDDVNFASVLIDSLIQDYSIAPACVYSTGMSNGAFLTYIIGCNLSAKITAIASVTGNMATLQQFACSPVGGMPVMEIHGTADAIVAYNGSLGVSTVPNTVSWWVNKNSCDTAAVVYNVPDINTADSCHAIRYTYNNGIDNSKVIFYKIINGGHTWPGALPFAPLGNTCEDFKASEEIWKFFKSYCSMPSAINEISENNFSVYPNPVSNFISVSLSSFITTPVQLEIINTLGQSVLKKTITSKPVDNTITLDASFLKEGVYFIRINNTGTRILKIE